MTRAVPLETVQTSASQRPKSTAKPKVDFLFSKISWKVITAVFATIIILEAGVLYITVQNYEKQQLAQLAEASKNTVTPVFTKNDKGTITINTETIKRLIETTPIKGLSIYNPQGGLFAQDVFGEPPLTTPDANRI
ncbi:MAG TPA: hypothetical protein VGF14_06090, partial [Alphaproteobacteria bacterium]